MKQMGKWLVTAVLALLMMIPAVLAEETASFMTLTVPTTAQEIDLGQNVVTDYDALCRFLDELPDVRKVDMFATKISRKDIEMLAARYPQVKFGWTMRVGDHLVRTDATAFSTLHNNQSATHTSADFRCSNTARRCSHSTSGIIRRRIFPSSRKCPNCVC